ncbi:MAG TPA: Lrp/AsnC family transcriptional regulator [Mycobacteriales bacterium]|nr:Lrp/AsnC family transcriptional regulator [Mycobacteriales bacterium]
MPAQGLDQVDWQLLEALQEDGRLSYNELSRRVHLSAPAVAERVRRLESTGVITGYHAQVDPTRAGLPLLAFIQLRCRAGSCLLKTGKAQDYPEIAEVHKLSGEHCSLLKVRSTSLTHFESFLDRLGTHGEMRTHIVLSTQHEQGWIQQPADEPEPVPPAQGWRGPNS